MSAVASPLFFVASALLGAAAVVCVSLPLVAAGGEEGVFAASAFATTAPGARAAAAPDEPPTAAATLAAVLPEAEALPHYFGPSHDGANVAPSADGVAAGDLPPNELSARGDLAATQPTKEPDMDMQRFLAENALTADSWQRFRSRSLDELSLIQREMDSRFIELREKTDSLAARRADLLARGEKTAADRLLASEIVPAFEERKRIAAEAILVARARIEQRGARLEAALAKTSAK